MRKEIQLYEYQKDMLRQIENAFVTHQSVMIQMPTGTGKTVLISEVVKREERRVKNPCVWIVVHRRELVEQIKETLERRLGTSLDAEREIKRYRSFLYTVVVKTLPRIGRAAYTYCDRRGTSCRG